MSTLILLIIKSNEVSPEDTGIHKNQFAFEDHEDNPLITCLIILNFWFLYCKAERGITVGATLRAACSSLSLYVKHSASRKALCSAAETILPVSACSRPIDTIIFASSLALDTKAKASPIRESMLSDKEPIVVPGSCRFRQFRMKQSCFNLKIYRINLLYGAHPPCIARATWSLTVPQPGLHKVWEPGEKHHPVGWVTIWGKSEQ